MTISVLLFSRPEPELSLLPDESPESGISGRKSRESQRSDRYPIEEVQISVLNNMSEFESLKATVFNNTERISLIHTAKNMIAISNKKKIKEKFLPAAAINPGQTEFQPIAFTTELESRRSTVKNIYLNLKLALFCFLG